jgi:hypothetical protein
MNDMNKDEINRIVNDGDEIDRILSEFELAEYITFMIEYVEAMLADCALREDARFCIEEYYFPNHPVMLQVCDLLAGHGKL